MGKENISDKFRKRKINKTRDYFIKGIKQNDIDDLKAQKDLYDFKLCCTLNYVSFCSYYMHFNFCF